MLLWGTRLLIIVHWVGASEGDCYCYDNEPNYNVIWKQKQDCRLQPNFTHCLCYRRERYSVSENWDYEVFMEVGCANSYQRKPEEVPQKPTPENICTEKPTDIENHAKAGFLHHHSYRFSHYTAGVCCLGHLCNKPEKVPRQIDTECPLGSYKYAPLMWNSSKKTAKCYRCAVDFFQPKNIEPKQRTWHDYRIAGECAFFWTCDNATKRPMKFRFDVNKDDYEFVFQNENPDFCSIDLQGNLAKYLDSSFDVDGAPANWAQIARKLIKGLTCFFSSGTFTDADVEKLETKSECYFCSFGGKETSGQMSYKYDCHTDEKTLPTEGKQGEVTVKVCHEENLCNAPVRCSAGKQPLLAKRSSTTSQCLLCGTQLVRQKSSNDRAPYALTNLATYGFCINDFTCPDKLASIPVPNYETVGNGPVCFDDNPTADELLQRLLKPSFNAQFSDGFQYPTGYKCFHTSQHGETWWNGLMTANFTCGDCATVLWTPAATDMAIMYKQTCLRDATCEKYAEDQSSRASYRNRSGVVNVRCCHGDGPCNVPPEPPPYSRQCYVTSADTGRVVLAVREGDQLPEFHPITEAKLKEEAKVLAHKPCTLCARLVFENGRADLACRYSEEAGNASSVAEHDCLAFFDTDELKRRVGSGLVSATCSSDQFGPNRALGLRCYLGDEFDRQIQTTDKIGVPLKACAKLRKLGSPVWEYPAIRTDTECSEYEAQYGSGEFRCCHSGPGTDSEPCNSFEAQQDVASSQLNKFSCYTEEATIAKDCVGCYIGKASKRRIAELACFQGADMKRCTAGHCCFGDRCNDPACFLASASGRPCPTDGPFGVAPHTSHSCCLSAPLFFPILLNLCLF